MTRRSMMRTRQGDPRPACVAVPEATRRHLERSVLVTTLVALAVVGAAGSGPLGASVAAAQNTAEGRYLQQRFERTHWRGMGGVDIAADPTTPANGALGGGLKLRIFSVDVYSTLSEGIRAARTGYDIWDTRLPGTLQTDDDFRELQQSLRDISDQISGDTFILEFANRVELFNVLINTEKLSIQIGAYSEGIGGARFVTPPMIELREEGGSTYLEFGERTRVIRAGARQDSGLSLGLGGSIALGAEDQFRLALGVRLRGFYRVLLPLADSWVDAQVYGPANIDFPGASRMIRGFGFGTDLYASMHFSEDLTGFRIGAYLEDAFAYTLDARGRDMFMTPRLGVGMSWVSSDERITLGADFERLDLLDPTIQLGMAARVGPEQLGLTPMWGVVLNHRDIEGTRLSPAFTLGLRLALGAVHVATVAEVRTGDPSFNAGLSLLFGN